MQTLLRTAAMILVSTFSLTVGASPLTHAIEATEWTAAHRAYAALSPAQSSSQLAPMARANNVMAQWFLADSLAKQGQLQLAANWFYTASLGTRMDSALCTGQNAQGIEGRFVQAFKPSLDRARSDPSRLASALRYATEFHATRLNGSQAPAWACLLAVNLGARNPKRMTIQEKSWPQRRKNTYMQFQEATGLDFSRSRDALEILPGTSHR